MTATYLLAAWGGLAQNGLGVDHSHVQVWNHTVNAALPRHHYISFHTLLLF